MDASPASDAAEARRAPRLTRPGVLIIDAQPGFLKLTPGTHEPFLQRLGRLLLMATHLELPTVATFEDSEANGYLPMRLEGYWPGHGTRHEKRTFDCCADAAIVAAIAAMGRRQLLVAGVETDVCVLQSVLSLLELGYEVFLLEDVLFSSEPHTGPAIRRMEAGGAIPCTLKTAFYELKKAVGVPEGGDWPEGGWERLIERFGPPEELPPWEPGA
jgi:nicotinamidase-related amidase